MHHKKWLKRVKTKTENAIDENFISPECFQGITDPSYRMHLTHFIMYSGFEKDYRRRSRLDVGF